jgi:multidrug efflux pump subunit AcrB
MEHGEKGVGSNEGKSNLARFSVNNPAITLVFIFAFMCIGIVGYRAMPQRKDPDIPIRTAAIQVPWPGNRPQQIEMQVTRKIEEICGRNKNVKKVESTVQPGLSTTYFELEDTVKDAPKEFDDVGIKLQTLGPMLPQGAGPIIYIKDFGDTAALMLTVASPPYTDVEIEARALPIKKEIDALRARRTAAILKKGNAYTVIYGFPKETDFRMIRQAVARFQIYMEEKSISSDLHFIEGDGFLAIDFLSSLKQDELKKYLHDYLIQFIKPEEQNPDAWMPFVIKDTDRIASELRRVAPDRYTYRELDDFTRIIADGLRTIKSATSVDRKGVLSQAIYLQYAQERLAAYGINPTKLPDLIGAQNISGATGMAANLGQNVLFQTTGQFRSMDEIGGIVVGQSHGSPVYLRDVVNITKSYRLPASYLNYLTWRDGEGSWNRSRSITLSVQMKPGCQIHVLGKDIDEKLDELRKMVPRDLVIVRTSDQPRQVRENISLFNSALYEAIILVVLISFIGFWDWRSALIMALSIPVTLGMTYAGMWAAGIDLQQVSIGSLIVALGLLVDNPVVAGDSIKVSLADGNAPKDAAWLGPTRLFKAIAFATLTNIAAYAPLATISGDVGKFLYSLPVVITISLVTSVLTAQCFVPVIGRYILKPQAEVSAEELRRKGFPAFYYRFAGFCVHNRWMVLGVATVLLAAGFAASRKLPVQMFPDDLQYICTVDINLPSNSNLGATNEKTGMAEKAITDIADELGKDIETGKIHIEGVRGGKNVKVLKTLCSFLGGGGPRFWFSIQPELSKISYAQILVECNNKRYTNTLVTRLIDELPDRVPGIRVDVRKLQTGTSYKTPVELYVTGPDDEWKTLLGLSDRIQMIFREDPTAISIHDDWQDPIETVNVDPVPDKANLAGVTNIDVARSMAMAMDGVQVGTLMEGYYNIPLICRMRPEDRALLGDLRNLYVYSSSTGNRIPLRQIVSGELELQPFFIQRRNFHRVVKPGCFPVPGAYASVIYNRAWKKIREISLMPGYHFAPSGEKEKTNENFPKLGLAMLMSVIGIFLCLVVQFRSAIKPFIVFAAVPFGLIGALFGLILTGRPFGFMAFLGVASLVGVIVSHIIVLFDYIEEMHERGKPVMEAVIDAGLVRLRPVMITVAATVIALFPLALHGGPLWEPLCFVQIGGLSLATLVTLILVPTIYCVFVMDLKLVKWNAAEGEGHKAGQKISAEPKTPDGPENPDHPASPDAPAPEKGKG